jgi:flagellar biosynthesis component FlhA
MNHLELYDILTLENNKEYTVANMASYEDNEYLYLIEIDKDENLILDNQIIAKRVIKDGEESVELITSKKEYNEVSKIFRDLFQEMALEDTSEN